MKKKYLYKILSVITVTVSLTICGCGKAEEENAAGGWEKIDTATVDMQTDETKGGADADKEPGVENKADVDNKISGEAENGTGKAEPEQEVIAEKESSTEGGTAAKGEWQTIEGSIETIGEGSFIINQIFAEEMEDGSQIAYEDNEEKTLITVYYSEETEFIVRTTTDGLTSTDRPGTEDELLSASSVILSGNWDGERFQAGQIVIFIVDM